MHVINPCDLFPRMMLFENHAGRTRWHFLWDFRPRILKTIALLESHVDNCTFDLEFNVLHDSRTHAQKMVVANFSFHEFTEDTCYTFLYNFSHCKFIPKLKPSIRKFIPKTQLRVPKLENGTTLTRKVQIAQEPTRIFEYLQFHYKTSTPTRSSLPTTCTFIPSP